MGAFSTWHLLIVLVVVVLMFGGKGKISGIMGEFAHGIRNFKEGLKGPTDTNVAGKHETVEAKVADEVKQG